MKIITNTNRHGELCYVQVKDILFLARLTKNKNVMQQYINLVNQGYGDNDFIKINQPMYINAIKKCEYIVDFLEFGGKEITNSYLSRYIVTLSFFASNDDEKKFVDYKMEGIRDIMAFKRGEIDFKIPLVPNGNFEYTTDDGKFFVESTVVDNCFTLKVNDGSDVQNHDYFDFYLEALDKIYDTFYPNIEKDERKYDAYDRGSMIIIYIDNKEKKKKESKIDRILSKIKKGS